MWRRNRWAKRLSLTNAQKPGAVIDAVAAEWVARIDRGPLSPDETSMLDSWLASDSRNHGAFVRASAIWGSLKPLPHEVPADAATATDDLTYEPVGDFAGDDTGEPAGVSRFTRRAMLASGAAAVFASGAFLLIRTAEPAPQQYSTVDRRVRGLRLADGSRAILNANSVASVAFDSRRRLLVLDRGEGWFDVVEDRARPFFVHAGMVKALAGATSFALRRADAEVEIIVARGVVELQSRSEKVQLHAGTHAAIAGDNPMRITTMSPDLIARELAWREGRIVLAGETVAEAVTRFNRVNAVKIVAEGPLSNAALAGSFNMYDPDRFAMAISHIFSATITRPSNRLIVLTAAPVRRSDEIFFQESGGNT